LYNFCKTLEISKIIRNIKQELFERDLLNPHRLLIIDDEPDICEVVSLQLEDEGFYVESATTTVEGIEKLKTKSFDIVISDLRMSDGGALRVIENKDYFMNPEVPIVIMSGNTHDYKHELQNSGACCILEKPISLVELIERIRRILESST
jgi:DNA-binding response OmpR family regulator